MEHPRHECATTREEFYGTDRVCENCVCSVCGRYSVLCETQWHRWIVPTNALAKWAEPEPEPGAAVDTTGYVRVSSRFSLKPECCYGSTLPASTLRKYLAGGDVTGNVAQALIIANGAAVESSITTNYRCTEFNERTLNVLFSSGTVSVWAKEGVIVPLNNRVLFSDPTGDRVKPTVELLPDPRTEPLEPHQVEMVQVMLRTEVHGVGHRLWPHLKSNKLFVSYDHRFCSTTPHDNFSFGVLKLPPGFGTRRVVLSLIHHHPKRPTLIVTARAAAWRRTMRRHPTLIESETDPRGVVLSGTVEPGEWWRVVFDKPSQSTVRANNVWHLHDVGDRELLAAVVPGPDDLLQRCARHAPLVHTERDLEFALPTTLSLDYEDHHVKDAAYAERYADVVQAVESVSNFWCVDTVLARIEGTHNGGETFDFAAALPGASRNLVGHSLTGGFAFDVSECPICLDPIRATSRPMMFPCKHTLCGRCMDLYTANSDNRCPNCREPFEVRDVQPARKGGVRLNAAHKIEPLEATSVRVDAVVEVAVQLLIENKKVAIRCPFARRLREMGLPFRVTEDPDLFNDGDADLYIGADDVPIPAADAIVCSSPYMLASKSVSCFGKAKRVTVHTVVFDNID